MNKKVFVVCLILSALSAWAQQKEPSTDLQLKFMKTQRLIQSLNQKQQDLSGKYQQLLQKFNQTPEVQTLQTQANQNAEKLKGANLELESLKDQAYKDLSLDKKDYDFDEETLTFSPKAKAAEKPPSTSPEKK